ncbi:MAG TPA: nuclear transport factor 2 family protein [Candidatus Tumulicola sp.]|jgi:hypothetical protein
MTHRRKHRLLRVSKAAATGALAAGSAAAGAIAIGSAAVGAIAIGAMAIGKLAVGSVRIARLQVDELIVPQHTPQTDAAERNRALVEAAFERWRAGTGGLFDLLAPDVRWEMPGQSAVAGIYHGKEAFMLQVIAPLSARFMRPLVPTVRRIYSDGDTVIALFDAETMARDDVPYRNSYSWYLRFRDGQIDDVVAFFDSTAFNELWTRVSPTEN